MPEQTHYDKYKFKRMTSVQTRILHKVKRVKHSMPW